MRRRTSRTSEILGPRVYGTHALPSRAVRHPTSHEAHHPDPLPQRGGDAARDAGRPPPRDPGLRRDRVLVIDDGSTDRTIEVARANGVHHIVKLTNNKGLAAGFQAGLDACLKLGADVVVNTDADNQYSGHDIHKLVAPILAGSADMVVGDRETDSIEHFSPLKKRLQKAGSWVVRQASDTDVPDTTSGFRAYNREAAIQMAVVSKYTYTLETIIQAGKLLVATDHVAIGTNPKTRESRLFPSMSSYVRRNAVAIARIYTQYEPLKVFSSMAAVPLRARADPVRALRRRLHRRRGRRPRPVADLRRGALQRRGRRRDARHHRRPALQPAHHVPAHLRARAPHRAAAQGPAVPLRARSDRRRGQPATTRAPARPAAPKNERLSSYEPPPSPSTTKARSPATRTTSTARPTRSSSG